VVTRYVERNDLKALPENKDPRYRPGTWGQAAMKGLKTKVAARGESTTFSS